MAKKSHTGDLTQVRLMLKKMEKTVATTLHVDAPASVPLPLFKELSDERNEAISFTITILQACLA